MKSFTSCVRLRDLGGSLSKVIQRIMKVYSLKRTAMVYTLVMVLHGRNSMSYTPQYTIMSPLQPKCQPRNEFHPAAAEQYHLRRSYVSSSLSYMTKTENWNSVLTWSIGEYFETIHS